MGEESLKSSGKRRPGGQPGNRNSRKHGIYSDKLSPEETHEFLELTTIEDLHPELARLRVKINTLLLNDPANRRALRAGAGLLAEHYRVSLGLDKKSTAFYRHLIMSILDYYASVVIAAVEKKT